MHRKLLPLAVLALLAAALWVVWQRDLPIRDATVLGAGLLAAGLFALAGIWEVLFRRVDDRFALILVALYVPWFVILWPGYDGFMLAGIALILGLLAYWLVGLGGGAVKLAVIAALWTGPAHIYTFGALLFAAAMVMAVLDMALRRKKVPFALAIGGAAAYVLLIKLQPLSGWQVPLG